MRFYRPTLTLRALTMFACLLFVSSVATTASAQEEKKAEEKKAEEKKAEEKKADEPKAATVEAKTLVTNLLNPSGLAIHGGTGHVFIANRHGVYRYLPDEKDRKKRIVIEIHSPTHGVYGKGPMYDIGPLGVAFLGDDQLVVGDGSRADGEELVRIYKIGKESPAEPAKEDSAVHTIGPIKAKEGVTAKGEGNFYGVAVGGGAIFVTCNGDDTKGWVSKIEIKDGKPGEMVPTIATKEATKVDAPVAITFSPDGKDLVVGQMGEMTVVGDSLLTIYDPATGKLKKSYKTGLSDIAGLAYSPKTKKLYATDFAWAEPENGGLFELVIDGDAVKATKILKLDKPAAIAFDKAGNLYLTEFGSADEGSKKNPGSLSVIEAGL